ncbi:MAG: hypothetical protein ACLTDM_22415 [Clostridium butyricum]
MCNCMEDIMTDISFKYEQNGQRAKVWSHEYIKFTYRKFTKSGEFSSKLGEEKRRLKYCPICGEKIESIEH